MSEKKRMADILKENMIKTAERKNIASKAIADFMFSEVIGDIFEKYNISDDDLRTLTRKAVNRAGLLFDLIKDEEDFAIFVGTFSLNAKELDNPRMTADVKKFADFFAAIKNSLANASDEEIDAIIRRRGF